MFPFLSAQGHRGSAVQIGRTPSMQIAGVPCRWKLLPEVFLGYSMRKFLLFVGQDQLGEDYLTYSHIWGSQNTLSKEYALHIQDIQAPPNKSCMRKFSPAWYCSIFLRSSEGWGF